jgi:small-conductance mechanosensitive channel
VAASIRSVLRDPEPEVELVDLRNGMHFALQVWSTQYLQYEGRLKSELNVAIHQKLGIRGIEITSRLELKPPRDRA